MKSHLTGWQQVLRRWELFAQVLLFPVGRHVAAGGNGDGDLLTPEPLSALRAYAADVCVVEEGGGEM